MCGIAGIVMVCGAGASAPAGEPVRGVPEAWLDLLESAVAHRGPDGAGRFRDRVTRGDGRVVEVGLVHRRLSIIDHAGGGQPMVAADGVVSENRGGRIDGGRTAARDLLAMVFNGCVYDHRRVRAELAASGRRFVSDHSDTEVLLQLYAAGRGWGEIDGMFAAGVWDRSAMRLTLARDAFGEKPLYWTRFEGGRGATVAAFASTAAALIRLRRAAGAPVMVREEMVREWLRFGWWGTPCVDVEEVGPGEEVRVEAGAGGLACERRAWVERDDGEAMRRRDDAMRGGAAGGEGGASGTGAIDAEIARLLAASVERRLEADVPVGCFLSGGVDSSLIAALAMRSARMRGGTGASVGGSGGDGRVRTFTVRMPSAGFDESAYAERVASAIGSEHTTLDCEADPAGDLVRLVEELGLPFGDSSLLASYWVSRAARREVKVALSGDGGDELFGGYQRYRAAGWMRSRPAMMLGARAYASAAERLGLGGGEKSSWTKLRRLGIAASAKDYRELVAVFQRPELKRVWRGAAVDESEWPARGGAAGVADAMNWDLRHYLPGDLLRKTDTASMSVALEVRCPMLERALCAAAGRAGAAAHVRGGELKAALKRVARRHVPAGVVDRKKMGFAVPIGEWLRTDHGGMRSLMRDVLGERGGLFESGEEGDAMGLPMDRGGVARMMREHETGARDHGQRLYVLTVLGVWRRWMRREGV